MYGGLLKTKSPASSKKSSHQYQHQLKRTLIPDIESSKGVFALTADRSIVCNTPVTALHDVSDGFNLFLEVEHRNKLVGPVPRSLELSDGLLYVLRYLFGAAIRTRTGNFRPREVIC